MTIRDANGQASDSVDFENEPVDVDEGRGARGMKRAGSLVNIAKLPDLRMDGETLAARPGVGIGAITNCSVDRGKTLLKAVL